MSPSPSVIVRISTAGKNFSRVNYSRRMYAIIRRYTPEVTEGEANECYANLTGLRTFFKMTYKELVDNILRDLLREIEVTFAVQVATQDDYDRAKNTHRRERSFSTYKELNTLFAGKSFVRPRDRKGMFVKRRKFTVPFLGKVK